MDLVQESVSFDPSAASSSVPENASLCSQLSGHNPMGSSSLNTTSSMAETQDQSTSRVVLLIGETGAGKSTFINYVANYFLKGSVESPKNVIPNKVYRYVTEGGYEKHSETNLDNPTVSKTRECITYSFHKERITYRFIDTPSMRDTSNFATDYVDDEAIKTILTAAGRTGALHAIILIINGSAARLYGYLRNALLLIAGNYPDVLFNNTIVIYTNCNFASRNFDERSLPFIPKKSFVMNNSAFSSLSRWWDEEDWLTQELNWKRSMRKMKEIVELIDDLVPQST